MKPGDIVKTYDSYVSLWANTEFNNDDKTARLGPNSLVLVLSAVISVGGYGGDTEFVFALAHGSLGFVMVSCLQDLV